MGKFKLYQRNQGRLFPASLDDYVPEGHLARLVYEVVERLDTRPIEDKYSILGQNSYHPKLLLKLLFYGYATGVRSGRKIAARCETDTAFMFLAEMYRPDFRTVSDFRKNNLAEIERYFVEIVRICKEMGLVKIGKIYLDGSKFKANAAPRKTKSQEGYEAWLVRIEQEIKGILQEAQEIEEKEDQLYGGERGDELPRELQKKEALRAKIEKVLNQLQRVDKEKINLTDPDSPFMKQRKGVIAPGYNCQVAAAEGQIIVAAEVVVEENDKQQLIPMLEKTEEVLGDKVTEIGADSGYASYDNYEYLADKHKEGYIPDGNLDMLKRGEFAKPEYKFHKENFRYDRDRDVYICPEGKELIFSKERESEEGAVPRHQRIYKAADCPNCPYHSQCTQAKYRTIYQDKREDLLLAMRQRLLSKEGQAQIQKAYVYHRTDIRPYEVQPWLPGLSPKNT